MNDELRHRTLELNDMNAFLETILTAIGIGIAALDVRQEIQLWNGQARELWGLTADEAIGQNWLALDIGLPVGQVRDTIRDCLSGASTREERTVDAVDRRGRAFRCRIVCLPLRAAAAAEASGVILMMEALPS